MRRLGQMQLFNISNLPFLHILIIYFLYSNFIIVINCNLDLLSPNNMFIFAAHQIEIMHFEQ